MDEKDNVTEQLKELVEAYDFNIDTLSKYLGLPADKVKILSQGDISFLPEDNMYRLRILNCAHSCRCLFHIMGCQKRRLQRWQV